MTWRSEEIRGNAGRLAAAESIVYARPLRVLLADGCWCVLALVPIELLKRHERFIEERVRLLAEDIVERGVLIKPILVDAKTMIVLDGHHRLEALRRLGARFIPAVLVDYDDERCVSVGSWRPGWKVTKQLVREAGLTGRLLPPRTSRHRVSFTIPEVNMPLSVLVRCSEVWVDGCKARTP